MLMSLGYGTLRHTFGTTLWSYDSCANSGLQYPPLAGGAWQIRRVWKKLKPNQPRRNTARPYVMRTQHFPARLLL